MVYLVLWITDRNVNSSMVSNVVDQQSDNNVTTSQQASVSTQASSPQELTNVAATTSFVTPTMTFGDVGVTKEHEYGSYFSEATSVGEFDQTVMAERQAPVTTLTWPMSATVQMGNTPLYSTNLLEFLSNYPRNASLIDQFLYMRADVEVTVRLNSNQFYFGSLMATLYPTNSTGGLLEQRAVLDPMIISASSAESIVKTWKYSFPQGWMRIQDVQAGLYPLIFNLDVLNQLSTANSAMPDAINVFVWARFTNIKLAYPSDVDVTPEAQSGSGFSKFVGDMASNSLPTLKKGIEKNSKSPSDDSGSTIDKAVSAIKRINLGDAISSMKSFSGMLSGFVLDKPDMYTPLTRVVNDNNVDMYISDIPDVNTFVGMQSDHYLDPDKSRIPMSKDFSVSDYARIPGLRATNLVYSTINTNNVLQLVARSTTIPSTQFLTPLDFAAQCTVQWRGSVKVCLQFMTSSFFSGRFVVQYYNTLDSGPSTDYSNGISRVINVKGDTVDCFTLPFLSFRRWYQATDGPSISLKLISQIASTDTAEDPQILVSVWLAGGDDVQFAYPSTSAAWSAPSEMPQAQTSVGSIFQESFPSINPGALGEVDEGFCTNETLGSISSICKRYAPLTYSLTYQDTFSEAIIDACPSADWTNAQLDAYLAFNDTFFGTWRQCFLYRSGGFRLRSFTPTASQVTTSADFTLWEAFIAGNGTILYRAPFDCLMRLTFPQVDRYPFRILNELDGTIPYDFQYFTVEPTGTGVQYTGPSNPHLIAARDDLQFGFPILPARIPEIPGQVIREHAPSASSFGGGSPLSRRRDKGKEKVNEVQNSLTPGPTRPLKVVRN